MYAGCDEPSSVAAHPPLDVAGCTRGVRSLRAHLRATGRHAATRDLVPAPSSFRTSLLRRRPTRRSRREIVGSTALPRSALAMRRRANPRLQHFVAACMAPGRWHATFLPFVGTRGALGSARRHHPRSTSGAGVDVLCAHRSATRLFLEVLGTITHARRSAGRCGRPDRSRAGWR